MASTKKKVIPANSYISNIAYPFKNSWDKNANYVEFEIHGINVSLINSIRRCIIGSVKTVGFRSEPYEKSTINIIENDSPLHNQFLGHRISMIPINISNVDGFNVDDYEFSIDMVNNTNFPQDITSEHIKIRRISTDSILSDAETRRIFPADPITKSHILLTRLKPKYYMYGKVINPDILGEYKASDSAESTAEDVKLTVRAKACISNGLENGHFNPTSCACHTYKIDPERAKIAERAYILSEQEKAVQKGLTPYSEEVLVKRFATTFAERQYYQDDRGNPTQFNFKIESIGVIPPLVVFHRAMGILKSKIHDFSSALVRNDSSNIKVEPSKEMANGFRLLVSGEDDTIGNVLQTYMTDKYADMGLPDEERLLNYVGYVRPHPLEMKLALTLQAKDSEMSWTEIMEKIITPTCSGIIKVINKMTDELETTSAYNNELKAINSL